MREILVNYADTGKLCSPWPITFVAICTKLLFLCFVDICDLIWQNETEGPNT